MSTRLASGRAGGAGGPAVDVRGLTKRYDDRCVLDGVDLVVEAGSVLALLGHNGAGKTTLVRVLSTLERPDGGSARVNGHDVVTSAARVRRQIALAGQYAAVDELLTGRGNLVMLGRLMGLGRAAARDRAQQLVRELDLEDAADRKVETYSGGMRRRLDLAACIVTRPAVLFLDEPTTGVDPLTRADLWSAVAALAAHGVAVLLTTQYLEEAEQIADAVVVLDHGRVVAQGSPSQVTASAGSERIVVTVADPGDLAAVARLLDPLASSGPVVDDRRSSVTLGVADPLRGLGDVRGGDVGGRGAAAGHRAEGAVPGGGVHPPHRWRQVVVTVVAPPDPLRCLVWVQGPDRSASDRLTGPERARWQAFHQQEDRDRFATGAVLLRRAVREATGDPQAVPERCCEDCGGRDHGPVTVAGRHAGTVGVSLSHSGRRVVVAVALGAPRIGVDVERLRARLAGLTRLMCTEREAAADLGAARPDVALTTRWVRKEAVLKAAHTGLRVPMRDLEVADHDEPAALHHWDPRSRPAAAEGGVRCADLAPSALGPHYVGALAVMTSRPVRWSLVP